MELKNPVDLLILNDMGQILLAKRSARELDSPGLWSIPGGTAEHGETIEDALRREIFEELGCNIERMEYFTSSFVYNSDTKATRAFYFFGEISGEIKLNKELSEYRRYDPNSTELLPTNMAYGQDIILKEFVKFIG